MLSTTKKNNVASTDMQGKHSDEDITVPIYYGEYTVKIF